jgi:septal ring factor EnvC (AmiA/AmiB activator)
LKFYIATTIQPDEYAKVIKDLRAEVERLKRDYEYDHKCLHEVRERCELWKQRAERAEAAMERLSEWQAGVIENARAHHAQLKDAIARAERAEAEIKDRAAMMRDVMRERDVAETELAAERARLDWLMNKSFLVMPSATGFAEPFRYAVYIYDGDGDLRQQYPSADTERAAIDAAMKEGAK